MVIAEATTTKRPGESEPISIPFVIFGFLLFGCLVSLSLSLVLMCNFNIVCHCVIQNSRLFCRNEVH